MDINTARKFFFWCTIINFAMLMFTFVMLILFADSVYPIHSRMFDISKEAFDIIIYCFIGLYKILWIFFNLVPWLALKITG